MLVFKLSKPSSIGKPLGRSGNRGLYGFRKYVSNGFLRTAAHTNAFVRRKGILGISRTAVRILPAAQPLLSGRRGQADDDELFNLVRRIHIPRGEVDLSGVADPRVFSVAMVTCSMDQPNLNATTA